ncbi:MFS multidrug transporter [Coccidioides posadasii str. Silveira]|uniref:MFS multidrug transporter n=1 Tax=Coccidioides posadasii (strain RMSCC 757 / Silveira) TaxID=443226 RepID=E9D6L2_COCPS|nr:MFS multidrug transporter [Coccidioides posadasii str. Silveira]
MIQKRMQTISPIRDSRINVAEMNHAWKRFKMKIQMEMLNLNTAVQPVFGRKMMVEEHWSTSPKTPLERPANGEKGSEEEYAGHNGILRSAQASSTGSLKADDGAENFKLSTRSWLVFMTLATLTLMVALDGTSISVALPIIASKLHGTAIEAFWSGTSFLLCSTVFQPTFASLSNIFGRKPLILTAIAFFLAGSLVAGLAQNFTHMLVGRSIQGVGGGGLIALSEIIVTDLVPLRLRGQYFGILSAMWSVGSVTGPILGGGFSQDVSWRWIFYINFPFIGFVGLIAFFVYETYFAAEPMIPITIFATRTAILTYIETVLHGLVLWCALYYMPLYYETVKEYSPIIAGVSLFPLSFTVAPSAAIVGIVVTKTGHYRWAIWIGFFFATLGTGLFCVLDVHTSIAGWIFLTLPAGLGLGMLFPSLAFAIQASALSGHMSIAVAMFSFFRAFGQAIGVAIGGVIFQNQMHENLLRYPDLAPLAGAYSKDAAGLVQIVRAMPAGMEKDNLKEAYTDSLRIVYAVCTALIGVAGVLSLFTESYDLNKGIDSEQTIREKKSRDAEVASEK